MRAVITGIVTGFRIVKGTKDTSDYAKLDILQAGDKEHDSSLTYVYVQDIQLIEQLLTRYADGKFRWIDTYCITVQNGRETVWLLKEILNRDMITVEVEQIALQKQEGIEDDGGTGEYDY